MTEKMDHFDLVIVGAGVAGASAAYHIQKASPPPPDTKTLLMIDAGPDAGIGIAPRHSGSATMASLPCVKMMVQVFAGSYDDFCRHHGNEGVVRYLKATQQGLKLQKSIAKEIWKEHVGDHMKELGSYYLARGAKETAELKREFHFINGKYCRGIQWCDKERLQQVPGMSEKFTGGIYFPEDAIIDSYMYARILLQHVMSQSNDNVQFWPNSTMKSYAEGEDGLLLELTNGKQVRAAKVVMATGALYQDPNLHGILKPCYSYLVNVPVPTDNPSQCQESPNFFTWGFTHDWCFTNGDVRVSGEDHFSAYKSPKLLERCGRLAKWTLQQYAECNSPEDLQNFDVASFPQQYGLYSETPDMVPLIGKLRTDGKVCYLTGCNAWGQTILSYCASLVPAILGLSELTDEQQDILKLVTIQRFSELPGVVNDTTP